jgi:hypothetical protein
MANLAPVAAAPLATNAFAHAQYTIKRPFFTFLGRKFYVYGPDGSLIMFVKHPLMKMRDEWNVFTDESEQFPLLRVKARSIIALNMVTDVFDARTGEKVGALRSQGLKSMFKDSWEILDFNDQPIGKMQEDSMAILRRLFPLLTGKWHAEIGGHETARIQQVFRFFAKEFTLDLSMAQGRMDPRFAVACAMLALMREIARESG